MKLYDVPRNVWIKVANQDIWFDHIDGMYSHCLTPDGKTCHIGACSDVQVIDCDDPRPMVESYTCGCGIYVHPSRANPDAIHIADCPHYTERTTHEN